MLYSYMSDSAWKDSVSQSTKVSDVNYIDDLFWDAKVLAKDRSRMEKKPVSKTFTGAEKWCLVSKKPVTYDDFNEAISSIKKDGTASVAAFISKLKESKLKLDSDCVDDCSAIGSATTCAIIVDDKRMAESRVAFFGE